MPRSNWNIATKDQLDHPRVTLSEPRETRRARRYAWADILFDAETARHADKRTTAFQRAIAWYDAYRYLYGNRNPVLDALLDRGYHPKLNITRQEYAANYRIWLKRLHLAGW